MWEGGFQGYVNAVLQHTFAIPLIDSSPSVPACGQNTLSKGIYDFHIQTLFLPTKANEAHGERHLDYDNLLTHMKKVVFSTQNSQNTPTKYSFSHNILFSHYVCWHFWDWPQLDILFRSPHLVEHLNNNTLKHAQSLFWCPFRLCPRVSRRIPAMMHGPSAVQV